jgi:hypothetical protein
MTLGFAVAAMKAATAEAGFIRRDAENHLAYFTHGKPLL